MVGVELLREYLSLLLEKGRPGGGLTDMGALHRLNPEKFAGQVRGSLESSEGDVDAAAEKLDVSPRTLYHYLDTEPRLAGVETQSERGEED